ncbi:MAG: hypothetical protein HYR85_10070 [Planctomycetes bacterium]|nr:hypothetical protein [Planctomycetota bacterium]MBI3846624.1 hypothetical protein [Planctomycetota bacterium]
MGYSLLGLESFALVVLVTTLTFALGARCTRKSARIALFLASVVAPGGALLGLTVLAALLRFRWQAGASAFVPVVCLTVAYSATAFVLFRRGLRRSDPQAPIAATTWPVGRLGAHLAVTAALFFMTFWNLDLAVLQRLASVRADANSLALSTVPSDVSDSDNAARTYVRALRVMASPEAADARGMVDVAADTSASISDPAGWQPRWIEWFRGDTDSIDVQDAVLRTFLARQAPAIALFREARTKPKCSFLTVAQRLDFTRQAPFFPLLTAVRVVVLDARVKGADGDLRAALDDVSALFAAARHVAGDGELMGILVGATCERMAVSTLAAILSSHEALPEFLADVQFGGEFSFERQFSKALRLEQALGYSAFSKLATDANGWTLGLGPLDLDPSRSLYRVFFLGEDLDSFRKNIEHVQALSEKPYRVSKDALVDAGENTKTRLQGWLTRTLAINLAGPSLECASADARQQLAIALLALHRYRARTGGFPESVANLSPDSLSTVPLDPFSGEPLRMRRADRRVILYSVGPDGKDSGGLSANESKLGDDIAVCVARL